jgi:glutamyl-tRNA synthetase
MTTPESATPRAIKTRLAPSPTGLLHFGNIRTALFNVLAAKKFGGRFLLRIEDTDLERSRLEFVEALYRDLRWLGLDWQEGGDVGGPAGPYLQSQRTAIYDEHLRRLESEGRVYPCFCSATELEVSRKLQAQAGQPPRYSGKCSHLKPDEQAAKLAQGLDHTVRFRMPRGVAIEFDDLVRGPQKFSADDIGDFIVRRSDGTYAFFYVNALDDALMAVTHVLRGEDHLTNTPRQLALLDAFGLPAPVYGHISLIVDGRGAPLSKRTGSKSVEQLREQGYLPEAVNNYLARLGHHVDSAHALSVDQLAAAFEFSQLGRSPARYDPTQLLHWQAQAVKERDEADLAEWLRPAVGAIVPDAELARFARAVKGNVTFPGDAVLWAQVLYADPLQVDPDAQTALAQAPQELFRAALDAVAPGKDYARFAADVKQAAGVQGRALFMPLRAALTGQMKGPEMADVFALMDPERTRRRIAAQVLSADID